MAWFKCTGGSGGGIILPNTIWYGTKSQFDALTSKDPGTLYYVKRIANGDSSNINNSRGIYIGEDQIFPPKRGGYDLWIENLYFPDTNDTGLTNTDYQIDTGLAFCSSDNISRDWQLEFKATLSTGSISGDQVICGCGNSNGMLYEVYLNTSGGLCIYGSGISDGQKVADANGHDIKLIFSRANNTIEVYKDGTLETTLTGIGSPSANDAYELGICKYKNSYRFHGTINYMKFKWLN